jgi:hypothetical protein
MHSIVVKNYAIEIAPRCQSEAAEGRPAREIERKKTTSPPLFFSVDRRRRRRLPADDDGAKLKQRRGKRLEFEERSRVFCVL